MIKKQHVEKPVGTAKQDAITTIFLLSPGFAGFRVRKNVACVFMVMTLILFSTGNKAVQIKNASLEAKINL